MKKLFSLIAALSGLPGFSAPTRSTPRTRPYNAPKRDRQRDLEVMEHNALIDAQKAEKRARKAARAWPV